MVGWAANLSASSGTDVEDFCPGGYNQVSGNVELGGWTGATLATLDCLCTVTGNFDLTTTASVTDGDGLANLETIGGNLTISGNAGLQDLSGFGALVSVNGSVSISNNVQIDDLGFGSLASINGDLTITWNSSLPTAEAQALADQVTAAGGMNGSVSIFGNAP